MHIENFLNMTEHGKKLDFLKTLLEKKEMDEKTHTLLMLVATNVALRPDVLERVIWRQRDAIGARAFLEHDKIKNVFLKPGIQDQDANRDRYLKLLGAVGKPDQVLSAAHKYENQRLFNDRLEVQAEKGATEKLLLLLCYLLIVSFLLWTVKIWARAEWAKIKE